MSNKIIIVWAIIVIFILSSIYILGNYYLKNEDFILLKNGYKTDVKSYLKENHLYTDNRIVIKSDTLIEKGYIEELKLRAKKCRAEAVVTKIFFFYVHDIRLTCK